MLTSKLIHKIRLPLVYLIVLFSYCSSFAQEPLQTVKGRIIDKETREALPGASIKLIESDTIVGSITDTTGIFTCDVPIGRRSFLVTYTGYENLLVPDVFELNVGTNYRRNAKGHAWIVSLDVQNLLNHENILVYEYRGSSQSVFSVRGMGIVPVANFRVEF